jgi:hypothetical protein
MLNDGLKVKNHLTMLMLFFLNAKLKSFDTSDDIIDRLFSSLHIDVISEKFSFLIALINL